MRGGKRTRDEICHTLVGVRDTTLPVSSARDRPLEVRHASSQHRPKPHLPRVAAQGVPGRGRGGTGEHEEDAVPSGGAGAAAGGPRGASCDGNLTAAGSAALRVDRGTLHRLLTRDRTRSVTADRIALTLGRHPRELWPEWLAEERASR